MTTFRYDLDHPLHGWEDFDPERLKVAIDWTEKAIPDIHDPEMQLIYQKVLMELRQAYYRKRGEPN